METGGEANELCFRGKEKMNEGPVLNRGKRNLLRAIYVMAVLSPLFILHSEGWPKSFGRAYTWGQGLGFVGIYALGIQFILSARWKFLEKGVGLDHMMRWHRYNGYVLITALALHPFLLLEGSVNRRGWRQVMDGFGTYQWLGIAALAGVFIIMITSIWSSKLRLKWQIWKAIHLISYGVLVMAFIHSGNLGAHITSRHILYFGWLVILILAGLAIGYNVVLSRWWAKSRWLKVIETIPHGEGAISINFEKPEGFDYAPGQFAFMRVRSKVVSKEEHHFTLASAPSENHLTFTIKNLGDYTEEIQRIGPGASIQLDGPYGVFSNRGLKGPHVFIVGGVGITPIRAMVKYMIDKKLEIEGRLLYSARFRKELLYKQEIDKWQRLNKGFEVDYFLTQEKSGRRNPRRIDEKAVAEVANKYSKGNFWISGPLALIKMVTKELRRCGINNQQIYVEHFNLR